MVTIHSLHLLFTGIFFLTVSQVAPFQDLILAFMLITGIILLVLGIIFRIVRTIGLKIKKQLNSERKVNQNLMPKNYYFSYFLISLALIFMIVGITTMPNTGYFIENYSPEYPKSSEIHLYEGDSSPKEIPPYENDVGITPIVPNE